LLPKVTRLSSQMLHLSLMRIKKKSRRKRSQKFQRTKKTNKAQKSQLSKKKISLMARRRHGVAVASSAKAQP